MKRSLTSATGSDSTSSCAPSSLSVTRTSTCGSTAKFYDISMTADSVTSFSADFLCRYVLLLIVKHKQYWIS